jgi:lipoate-protein ligase A
MPFMLRAIPFQRYSAVNILAILEVLQKRVADGSSPSTIFFGQWQPRTLTLPRWQTIKDVNLEQCAKEGIQVIYAPCGRAFLNTEKELYFAIIDRPNGTLDIIENYRRVENCIVAAFKSLNIPAYASYRVGVNGQKYGHDIKVKHDFVGDSYFQNMIAALAGGSDSKKVFVRHGAIFLEQYDELDFELMLRIMNVPAIQNRAMRQLSRFSTPLRLFSDAGIATVCDNLVNAFKAEYSTFTVAEQAEIEKRTWKISTECKQPDYYADLPGAKSRGLCMLNWGEQWEYHERT